MKKTCLGLLLLIILTVFLVSSCQPKEAVAPAKCLEKWVCAKWSGCLNNQQTRTCTDQKNCSTSTYQPAFTKPCGEEKPELYNSSAYQSPQASFLAELMNKIIEAVS